MALYNGGYPTTYQQYYPQYQQMPNIGQQTFVPQQMIQQTPQPQTASQQIQSGGFVSVRSEDEAKNYPVAPGNSVTFKDETLPYVYVKTMGFSQLDRPTFEKFRLVKEEDLSMNSTETIQEDDNGIVDKEEWEAFCEDIEKLKSGYSMLEDKIKSLTKNVESLTKKVEAKKK